MRKKRFYNNKKRNTKWTEQPKGRKISFADKYIDNSVGTDKFDGSRPKAKKPFFTVEKGRAVLKNMIVIICCFLIVGVGYTFMDFYMERKSMPQRQETDTVSSSFSDLELRIKASYAQPLSLDGGVMLSAVIDEAAQNGFSSIAFDAKRADGTIGYESRLATIKAYGAVSSPSSDVEKAVSMQIENDILPVAVVSCYKDNTATVADTGLAVMRGKGLYRDVDGYAYLNPDNESTYQYIKSIIDELKSMGITVFVLDNCTLPSELSDKYNDGFKSVSERLNKDFNGEIKLIEAVHITVTADSAGDIRQELDDKLTDAGSGQIYFITCTDAQKVKSILDKKEISDYIIAR